MTGGAFRPQLRYSLVSLPNGQSGRLRCSLRSRLAANENRPLSVGWTVPGGTEVGLPSGASVVASCAAALLGVRVVLRMQNYVRCGSTVVLNGRHTDCVII